MWLDDLADEADPGAELAEDGIVSRPQIDAALRYRSAAADGYVLLSENVADFARIAADHLGAGHHHPGVLIALSSRFSRRPGGRNALVTAVLALADQPLDDRVVFLERTDRA